MFSEMFTELIGRWRGRRKVLDSMADLEVFVREQANYITQSSAYSYCRARTGLMAPKLFTEPNFLVGLEVTRYATFIAVLGDVLMLVEGMLRPSGHDGQEVLHERLVDMFRTLQMEVPVPYGWRGNPGTEDPVGDFSHRLAQAQLAAPKTPDEVAQNSGRVLFEYLPLHPDMTTPDEEMVINSVRFRFLRLGEDTVKRLDPEALYAELSLL